MHVEKRTLLKSPHVYKKHRHQYELRTHARMLQVSSSSFFQFSTMAFGISIVLIIFFKNCIACQGKSAWNLPLAGKIRQFIKSGIIVVLMIILIKSNWSFLFIRPQFLLDFFQLGEQWLFLCAKYWKCFSLL